MTDTLEQRVQDLEHMVAHIPEDLDARFAGVDVKLASIRETLALHTQRFTVIERKVDLLAAQIAEVLRRLPEK
jgi:hypothetical protein